MNKAEGKISPLLFRREEVGGRGSYLQAKTSWVIGHTGPRLWDSSITEEQGRVRAWSYKGKTYLSHTFRS